MKKQLALSSFQLCFSSHCFSAVKYIYKEVTKADVGVNHAFHLYILYANGILVVLVVT